VSLGACVGNNFQDCRWRKKVKILASRERIPVIQDFWPSKWSAANDSSVSLVLRTHAPRDVPTTAMVYPSPTTRIETAELVIASAPS
jgi:hypothetical protein